MNPGPHPYLENSISTKIVGHPSPGRGPQGRAPGWVPGAHQRRAEAQNKGAKGRVKTYNNNK